MRWTALLLVVALAEAATNTYGARWGWVTVDVALVALNTVTLRAQADQVARERASA
ncbi:MAG TPA: hypothetical protein VG411_20400 [Actinomycetota bacterium]|nr:hypothetical protein [Actinomycetota bacterium]